MHAGELYALPGRHGGLLVASGPAIRVPARSRRRVSAPRGRSGGRAARRGPVAEHVLHLVEHFGREAWNHLRAIDQLCSLLNVRVLSDCTKVNRLNE